MNVRRAFEWMGGSVVIYVLMAACSGAGGSVSLRGDESGSSSGSGGKVASDAGAVDSSTGGALASGGAMGTGGGAASSGGSTGGSILDAAVDAIVDPVPDASAEPTPLAVAEEECSKTVEHGAYTYAYAERLYPGKTKEELSAVRVLLKQDVSDNNGYPLPPGYEWRESIWGNLMKDGAVAALCGIVGPTQFATKAIFIGP